MNNTVNFEIAKLLDDKNYPFVFTKVGEIERVPLNIPAISEVVMWLYEKHDIWIYLIPAEDNKKVFKPFFRGENITDQHLTKFFESPTEAYEAAITYTL